MQMYIHMHMYMYIMHMSIHMHRHMHSAMTLFQELETLRHLQSIKGRRKERDMSTSRKRVYRKEGNILIPIGLVQGKTMAGEGSQRVMDIPVRTNAMKLIVEIAEKEMNATVIGEIEIEIPVGPLTVLTKVRKIPMAGKGEEVQVRVGEVQGGIGTTAGQVGIMINDGEGRGQDRGLARGREAVIDTLKGDPDPIALTGGTIHTRTGLQGEMEEEGKIAIGTGQGEVPALADQVVTIVVEAEAEAKVKVVEEVEVRMFVDVVSPCHRNGAQVSEGGSALCRMNEDPKLFIKSKENIHLGIISCLLYYFETNLSLNSRYRLE